MRNRSFTARRGGRSRARSNYRPKRGHFSSRRPQRRGFKGQSISPDKFINKNPKIQTQESYTSTNSLVDFGFSEQIIKNLAKEGYVEPTRIQDEAIPHIMEGKDLVGLANTGSGKTAAFVLPILESLIKNPKERSVLIVAPTRELAQQIQEVFFAFSRSTNIYSTVCVGGMNIGAQIRSLSRKNHIVIGTPGRLKDLDNRGFLHLDKVSTFVLDEVDQMLDMGFLPDIKRLIEKLPKQRQSLCFSATMTPTISNLIKGILKYPVSISVRTSMTGDHIAQDIIKARDNDEKMKELIQLLRQDHLEKVLIFGEMKHSVQKLSNKLNEAGFSSVAIHGNKSQPQRQRALRDFKDGKVRILVATGVASRGLDIPNVSHVINYDRPQTHEEYVHRIGRTGRAGKPGQAYTFV